MTAIASTYNQFNGMGYFLANDVYPQAKNDLAVFVAPFFEKAEDAESGQLITFAEYGITDSWLVIGGVSGISYTHIDNESTAYGTGNSFIGTKYSFMNIDDTHTHVAIFFTVLVPHGNVDRALSDGFIEYNPTIIAAHDFQHKTWNGQLFGTLGVRVLQRIQNPNDPEVVSSSAPVIEATLGYAVRTRRVNYSLDFDWYNNHWARRGDINELYVTPGIFILICENADIGIGVPVGLTKDADKFKLLIQGSYTFSL